MGGVYVPGTAFTDGSGPGLSRYVGVSAHERVSEYKERLFVTKVCDLTTRLLP
jgi:hypothetical protein